LRYPLFVALVVTATPLWAEDAQAPPPTVTAPITVACASKPGERQHCPAATAKGVILAKSAGESPCLLGKTWGYDDKGVWVSDGCSAEFVVGQELEEAQPKEPKTKSPAYIPNRGFKLFDGEKGQVYLRLFTYVRYLNQKGLDSSYTDYFGNTHSVKQRADVQLNKFFMPLSGWFLTPRFGYYLYVWSSNPSQGEPAQVVGGGNIFYTFNKHATLGGGIAALPSNRSTGGQFPYWLGMDDRLVADEFFRGSYTTGIWLKGEISTKVRYVAMLANNLSTLGVSASQLDNTFDTATLSLQWLPSTGEFGPFGEFGDFAHHEKVATRLGAHYTHSTEDKQSQPGQNGIENSQVRLTDGSVIFTPDLFGPGIAVEKVKYQLVSADAGIKYKGLALEAEYYWRWLSDFVGPNTAGLADIDDHGFQVQSSAMAVPKRIQVYLSGSAIRGRYGNGSEVRAGASWFIARERELRLNPEWIHLNKCPVGYTAVPYPVGGNGDVFHVNFEMSF
jgi:hypothetical protein